MNEIWDIEGKSAGSVTKQGKLASPPLFCIFPVTSGCPEFR